MLRFPLEIVCINDTFDINMEIQDCFTKCLRVFGSILINISPSDIFLTLPYFVRLLLADVSIKGLIMWICVLSPD